MQINEEHIDDLLIKYLDEEATGKELSFIETWLENKDNRLYFEEIKQFHARINEANEQEPVEVDIEAAWMKIDARINAQELEKTQNIREDQLIDTSSEVIKAPEKEAKIIDFKTYVKQYWQYAAIAVVTFGLMVWMLSPSEKGSKQIAHKKQIEETSNKLLTVSCTNQGSLQQTLPDGSEITLRQGSSISYPSLFDKKERKVSISGEAYFSVSQQNETPFIVEAQNSIITVLGTSFTVKAYKNQSVEVSVEKGTVVMATKKSHPNATKQALTLEAGEKGIVSPSDRLIKENVNTSNLHSWNTGKLIFVNQPFDQVFEDLERHYQIKINIENADFSDCPTYTASKSKIPKLKEYLDELRKNYQLNIIEQDDIIIVDGKGC